MGKAFEKQIRAIEDQGKKQVDALKSLKPEEIKPKEIKPVKYGDYFLNGLVEIKNYPKIDFDNLKYTFKDRNNNAIAFIGFKGPLHSFKSIYNGNITLEDVEKDQIKLKSDLGHIRQGNPKNRSQEQNNVMLLIFMNQEKKLSKCLIIMLKICLELFMDQNKEQDFNS